MSTADADSSTAAYMRMRRTWFTSQIRAMNTNGAMMMRTRVDGQFRMATSTAWAEGRTLHGHRYSIMLISRG